MAGVGTRSVARRAGVRHTTARSWCWRHRQRARQAAQSRASNQQRPDKGGASGNAERRDDVHADARHHIAQGVMGAEPGAAAGEIVADALVDLHVPAGRAQ